MTTAQFLGRRARPFVLLHRPPGSQTWTRLGYYRDVVAAVTELERVRPALRGTLRARRATPAEAREAGGRG